MTYAMSCLRANPLTGEMIDGDVIFDASWIRYWKQEFAFLAGGSAASRSSSPTAASGEAEDTTRLLDMGRVISPIMAAKQGYGLPFPIPSQGNLDTSAAERPEVVPAEWSSLQVQLRRRQAAGHHAACQYSVGMRPGACPGRDRAGHARRGFREGEG